MLFSGKKGYRLVAIVVFLSIIFSTFASGAKYNAVVWVSPSKSVEMSHAQYNISVNNYGSTHSVVALYAHLAGLVPTQVISVSDWDGALDNTTSRAWWENGTISNNVFAALFQFSGIAPNVASNTSLNLTITTIYHNGHSQTHVFPITIFNDASGPELSDSTLSDGTIIVEDTTITAGVNATDPETGVTSVIFSHGLCGEAMSDVTLAANSSRYSASVNLSGYASGASVCYSFTATSGGGATTTLEGTLHIDGEEPVVTPTSPTEVANSATPFTFSVTDDASPSMSCEVLVDGAVIGNVTVANGASVSVDGQPADAGMHVWKARCTDAVNRTGESSETSYLLDLRAPDISVYGIAGVLGPISPIGILVTDDDEVGSVSYSINGGASIDGSASMEIDTTDFNDGLNTLTVVATDAAGNTNTESYSVLVDKSAPNVALSGPLTTTDIHASFLFTVVDTYDDTLDCTLFVEGVPVAIGEAANGSENTILYNHSLLGIASWRIDCDDDGSNTGSSETWTVNFVDESGPDIAITSAEYYMRGSEFSAQAVVTDISPVDSVSATLIDPDGDEHTALVNVSGSTYSISYDISADAPIGIWTIRVLASDTRGNDNTVDSTVIVTNAYVFDLDVNPNPSSPNSSVTLIGTVRKDDGTTIPETQVKVWLPNGFAYLTNISDTGTFSHIFGVSDVEDDYIVRASVAEALTAFMHENTTSFTVRQPSSPVVGDGSGKRSRGRGSGSLGVESSSSIALVSALASPEALVTSPQLSPQEVGHIIADSASSTATDSEGADGLGVGSATSIFSLRETLGSKAIWTAIVILLTCGLVAWHPRTKKKKE